MRSRGIRSRASAVVVASAIVLSSSPAAGEGWGLVSPAPEGAADRPESEAVVRAVARIRETLGAPAPLPAGDTVSACPGDSRPLGMEALEAAFEEARGGFFEGTFERAADSARVVLRDLLSACRPAAEAGDGGWSEPGAPGAVHDVGAMLLWAATETGPLPPEDESLLRRVLAVVPEGGPSEGTFPPSVADRYAALRPDHAELATVTVAAPGCETNVAGRTATATATVTVAAGPVAVGLLCPGASPVALVLAVEAGSSVDLSLAAPTRRSGTPSSDDEAVGRALAGLARLRGLDAIVSVRPAGGAAVRVVAWIGGGRESLAAWSGDAGDPSLGRAVAPIADRIARPAGESVPGGATGAEPGVVPWIALPLVLAGGGAVAGGAFVLVESGDRRSLADRAATAGGHDALIGEADDLEIAGWAIAGVGAALVAGAAIWWIADAVSGESVDDAPVAVGVAPLLGRDVVGLSFGLVLEGM